MTDRHRPRPVLLTVRIALWRARRVLGLAALAVVALGVARTAAPQPPATVPVVVAARDVAAGATLTDADLRVVRAPHRLVPHGATDDASALVGAEVVVGLAEGLAVVPGLLAGERFAVDPPEGAVVVPVPLADPTVASLLRPGDRVDVVTAAVLTDAVLTDAAPGGAPGADVVAHAALVLEARAADDGGTLGVGGRPGALVVAVPPDDGRRIAAIGAQDALGAVLVE